MPSLLTALLTLACLCAGTILGSLIRSRLPGDQLLDESRDVVKMASWRLRGGELCFLFSTGRAASRGRAASWCRALFFVRSARSPRDIGKCGVGRVDAKGAGVVARLGISARSSASSCAAFSRVSSRRVPLGTPSAHEMPNLKLKTRNQEC